MGFNISLNLIDSNLSNPFIKGSDSFNFFSYSFFDNEIVAHVSMAQPTSKILRQCCEQVLKKLKDSGIKDSKIEGKDSNEWKLVDGIDLIVHIFHPEKRSFYELEKMWSELIPKEKLII